MMLEKYLDVLSKFERVDITDLDSLELVRFYLEIEDIFDIEIKENDFYRLKSVDSIVDYIRNKSFFKNVQLSQTIVLLKNMTWLI